MDENRNRHLAQELGGLLRQIAPAAVATRREFFLPAAPAEFLLFQGADGLRVDAPHPIVVLAPDLVQIPEIRLPQDARLILSSQDPQGADFASREKLEVLDCGLSLRDTLTFSSRTEHEAVITLQRPLEDLWGRTVDPVDLPLILTREFSPHLLLYCAGICLMAGWADRLPFQKF